jgi:hypothetical protein
MGTKENCCHYNEYMGRLAQSCLDCVIFITKNKPANPTGSVYCPQVWNIIQLVPTTHPPAALWELPLVVESLPTSQQLSAQLHFSGALHYSRPNAPKHLIFIEHTIFNFIRLSGCGNLNKDDQFQASCIQSAHGPIPTWYDVYSTAATRF